MAASVTDCKASTRAQLTDWRLRRLLELQRRIVSRYASLTLAESALVQCATSLSKEIIENPGVADIDDRINALYKKAEELLGID